MWSKAVFHFLIRSKDVGEMLFKHMTQKGPEVLTPNSYSDLPFPPHKRSLTVLKILMTNMFFLLSFDFLFRDILKFLWSLWLCCLFFFFLMNTKEVCYMPFNLIAKHTLCFKWVHFKKFLRQDFLFKLYPYSNLRS